MSAVRLVKTRLWPYNARVGPLDIATITTEFKKKWMSRVVHMKLLNWCWPGHRCSMWHSFILLTIDVTIFCRCAMYLWQHIWWMLHEPWATWKSILSQLIILTFIYFLIKEKQHFIRNHSLLKDLLFCFLECSHILFTIYLAQSSNINKKIEISIRCKPSFCRDKYSTVSDERS